MSILNLPRRVLLDASTINFILDFGEQILDEMSIPDNLHEDFSNEIEALQLFFLAGERASWQVVVTQRVYKKVLGTKDLTRQFFIDNWLNHIKRDWMRTVKANCYLPSLVEAENIRAELYASDLSTKCPDPDGRLVIVEAVVNRCELICARSNTELFAIRDRIESLPVRVVTPTQLWERISPYAHIWER